jgi:hypothetical protein
MFCALQGAQDDEWLQSPEWKQYKNVRKTMEQRQMSVSVIQAANRICCRQVIDAEGHCPPADIFIVLPRDALGGAVLDDIKADMPGIKVTDWAFALDTPKEKKLASVALTHGSSPVWRSRRPARCPSPLFNATYSSAV